MKALADCMQAVGAVLSATEEPAMPEDQWQTTLSPVRQDLPPAGWYQDPALAGHIRYWDGQRWTEHVQMDPNAVAAAASPSGGEPEQVTQAEHAAVAAAQAEQAALAAAQAEQAAVAAAQAEQAALSAAPATTNTVPEPLLYNEVFEVRWIGGWPGLFHGENQSRALQRAIAHMNGSGRRIAAITTDRWSFFRRLGWGLVAVVTLGFVVRHENLLLVTEPLGPLWTATAAQGNDTTPLSGPSALWSRENSGR